ncbi:hypothetical protein V498_02922 [Pseudogymnoascus sp. VKM F-4517 (FW-2822)]|nr:hypothetical protein V498_02922 [Pseudogymnoascus sp. VKM F-4517 (FW-2822)]
MTTTDTPSAPTPTGRAASTTAQQPAPRPLVFNATSELLASRPPKINELRRVKHFHIYSNPPITLHHIINREAQPVPAKTNRPPRQTHESIIRS